MPKQYAECSEALGMHQVCKQCGKSTANCSQCDFDAKKRCYTKFIERCSTSKHKVTKVLRMDTANVKYLLRRHKKLKLIQLFRDPRGVLNSRVKTNAYYPNRFTLLEDAERLCNQMEKDIVSAENLRKFFPERVKIVQYEDFDDPIKLGTKLYSFLNMELTESAKSVLISPSKKKTQDGFHPDSFRFYFNWTTITSIDRICEKVYLLLGLRPFKNEGELHDDTISIVSASLRFPLEE